MSVGIGIVRGDIVGLKESAVSLARTAIFHRFMRTVLLQLMVAPHIPVGQIVLSLRMRIYKRGIK